LAFGGYSTIRDPESMRIREFIHPLKVGVVIALFQVGCVMPTDCDLFVREISPLNHSEQLVRYRRLPLQQQVAMYHCRRSVELPDHAFLEVLVDEQPDVQPYLLEELRREERAWVQSDIVFVFAVMALNNKQQGLPPLPEEVVEGIRAVVRDMKDPDYQHTSLEWLQKLEEENTRLPCAAELSHAAEPAQRSSCDTHSAVAPAR